MKWQMRPNTAGPRVTLPAIGIGALMAIAFASSGDVGAQPRGHSIYMTAVEFKGSTTGDKLGPPPIDPSRLSHGYAYKAPGQADPSAPQRWEVASYQFSPRSSLHTRAIRSC